MIPRFTMRQALSAPDLLGNALVTPPLPAWCRLLGQQPRDSAYDVQLLGSSSSPATAFSIYNSWNGRWEGRFASGTFHESSLPVG